MNIPSSSIQIDLLTQLFSQTTATSATNGLPTGDSPFAGSFASMLNSVADTNLEQSTFIPLVTTAPDSAKAATPTDESIDICLAYPTCRHTSLNEPAWRQFDQSVQPQPGDLTSLPLKSASHPIFRRQQGLALGRLAEVKSLPRDLIEKDDRGVAIGDVLLGSVIPPNLMFSNFGQQTDSPIYTTSDQELFAGASALTSRPLELTVTAERPTYESIAQLQRELVGSDRSMRSFRNPTVNSSNAGISVSGKQTTSPTAFGTAEPTTSSRVTVALQFNQPWQATDRASDVPVANENATHVRTLETTKVVQINRPELTEQSMESIGSQGQEPTSLARARFASQPSDSDARHPGMEDGFDSRNMPKDEIATTATRRFAPLESRSVNPRHWETTETTNEFNLRQAKSTDVSESQMAPKMDATNSVDSVQFKLVVNGSDSVTDEANRTSSEINKSSYAQDSFKDMESSRRKSAIAEFEAPPQLKAHSRFESHPKFETHPRFETHPEFETHPDFATHPQSVGNPVFDSNLQFETDSKPATTSQLTAPAEFETVAETGAEFEVVSRGPEIKTVVANGLPVFEGIGAAWLESGTAVLNETQLTSPERAELQINSGHLTTKTIDTSSARKPGAGQTLHAENELDFAPPDSESDGSSSVGHVIPVEATSAAPMAEFNQQESKLRSLAEPTPLAKKANGDRAKSEVHESTKVDDKSFEFHKFESNMPKVDAGRNSSHRAHDPELVAESKKPTAFKQDANQQFSVLSGMSSLQVANRELTQPANREFLLEAPVLEKIVEQITEFVDADSGWVSLEIHPPELGRLDILVSQNGNDLTAKIVAHEAATCDLLGHQKEELREMFAKQGMDLSNLDISHGRQSDDASNSGSRDRGSENKESSNFASRPSRVEVPKGERSIARSSGIDLLV